MSRITENFRKIAFMLIMMSVLITVGMAGVYHYFGVINNHVEVKQTLNINGNDWNDYIEINTSMYSGESYTDYFTINNIADDVDANISVSFSGIPTGMNISFHHNNNEINFPIYLKHGKSYQVEYIIDTDINLYPANYTVRMYFSGDKA